MKITHTRKELNLKDELGINETFEARIRGALSPYLTLLSMLKDIDVFKDPKYNDIFNKLKERKHLDKILYLLKESEKDREELDNM